MRLFPFFFFFPPPLIGAPFPTPIEALSFPSFFFPSYGLSVWGAVSPPARDDRKPPPFLPFSGPRTLLFLQGRPVDRQFQSPSPTVVVVEISFLFFFSLLLRHACPFF